VNNSGISRIGKLEATTGQDFDRVFEVNVKGFYNCHARRCRTRESKRRRRDPHMARPMPLAPPVRTTVFPSSRKPFEFWAAVFRSKLLGSTG
jgi:NAD(P)-dependent dehydrogenase (short-subunit alcohol dehydrogenase family)